MLTEGRIGLSALAEYHEQGRSIEGLGDRADGMDGMAGLLRIDDTGFRDA